MAEGGSEPIIYQGVVECDGCDGIKDVNNYCIDCPGNICDICKLTHCNTKLTKSHKVLPRTHHEVQRARRARKVYCQQHHDVEYVTFCIKCQVPCCPRCITGEHRGHEFSDLIGEISKLEKELIEMALDLESNKIPEAKKKVDEIDRAISEYEKRGDEIKISVKDRIDEIHREVDQVGEDALTTLENQRTKDIQQMQVTKMKISDNVAELEKRAETCRSAPADASLVLLKKKFIYLEPTQLYSVQLPGNITFEKAASKLPSCADLIGRIAKGKMINIDTSRKTDNSSNVVSFIDRKIEMKVVKTLERKRGDTVLHTINRQTWILNETAETISIFDDPYNQIKEIDLGFSCRDMTLTHTEDVIATDYINNRIVRISSSGSITELCSTAPLTPYGICVNNKQQIVVGVVVRQRGLILHSMLVVFSSDRSFVPQEIRYDQSWEPLFTGCINRVRQTVSGDYVVADDNKVICLSPEWNAKWHYKVGSDVYGLCCDKYNNIFVGDIKNSVIVILSREGKQIKTLITKTDHINTPYSLSVDSNGLLWIGQKDNILVVRYVKP